jgi:hypothetical protein
MDNDPFNRVPIPPLQPRREALGVASDPGGQQLVPRYAVEDERPGGGGSSSISGTDVIVALIASGAEFVEKTGCDSGTPYTYWAPEWTADPTP